MTLERIANEVVARGGLRVGKSSVDRMLKHMGFRIKKSLIADEQTRTDVAVKRGFFRRIVQTFMDTTRFIFFDETAANTKMTRLYGARQSARAWSLRSRTAIGRRPLLSRDWDSAASSPPPSSTSRWTAVIPRLRRTSRRAMSAARRRRPDGQSPAHKVAGVENAIRSAGASLLFTPPYSPDFNPIEKFFSKLKSILRRLGVRTKEALDDAIADVCATLTNEECRNFFISCGYGVD